jgi:photosystem II stability/assembly factor-like uncharacterized protein
VATLLLAAGLVACSEASRTAASAPQLGSAARAKYVCVARLPVAGTSIGPSVTCAPAGATRGNVSARSYSAQDVVLENQGVNVLLTLSNFSYSNTTNIFSMDCTVKNLLTQPIGSTNNSTTTPAGVRIYFTYGPVPNDGIGSVSIISPSGDTLFQGQEDPYFEFSPFIKAQASSSPMLWQFQASPNAIGFNFAVEVDAAVPSQNSILRWTTLRQGVTPHTLNGVWRSSASDVWAVGDTNAILNYDGTQWSAPATGLAATNTYNAVWGTSASDVWAVGNAGVAVHYNGTAWSAPTTGLNVNLSGIWGYSPTAYYTVASAGKAYFYNGSTWAKVNFGFNTTTNLHAVWGTDASHIFIVGDKGLILYYNGGSAWTAPISPTTQALYAIWGTSATNVYAVGSAGTIIHFNGTSWSTQTTNASSPQLAGVGGTDSTDIWAVGNSGETLHSADGTTWQTIAPVAGLGLSAVDAGSPGPLWAVGASGSLFSLSGTTVNLSDQSGVQLLGVWASSGSDVWAAAPGTILHYDGSSWSSAYISNSEPLAAIWGTGPTNVYVVGQKGTIANYNGTSWTSSVVNALGFNGIWGSSAANIYAVGNSGLVERYNGTSWSTAGTAGTGNVMSVWGQSSTFFAVASDGTAYTSLNGGTWNAVSFSPANSVSLYGVTGTSSSDVWATGNSGAAYIDVGSGFKDPSPANGLATNFSGVWNTSASDVYLVGANGTVQYFNGSVWFAMPTPVTTTLRAMYGTAQQNAYVVGDNGVVLWGTGP